MFFRLLVIFLLLVVVSLFLPQWVLSRKETGVKQQAEVEKLVFAHYMICCPTVGGEAGVEDFKNEIYEAQKRGIDGFALNCGGWDQTEPHYKKRTLLMYEAAKQLGTGFKLFVSADGPALSEVEDILITVREHPNQLRYNGRTVLSTFSGEGADNTAGRELISKIKALDAVIVPFFYPRPDITEHPKEAHARKLIRDFPELDGYFYFGAAGTGKQIVRSTAILARTFLAEGKIFMAGITPYYRGNESNFRLFETRGFESMALEWETAINEGAHWVELVTWNDWNESSYLAPFGSSNETNLWDGHFGPVMLSHVAYLDASSYYIKWFKNGSPPAIEQDQLFYFYRLHSKHLPCSVDASSVSNKLGRPSGSDNLLDHVFITVFLTEPAQLIINSGRQSKNFAVKEGVNHISMQFDYGFQRFRLIRDDKVLIDKFGEHLISESNSLSRFNYFSGSASVD